MVRCWIGLLVIGGLLSACTAQAASEVSVDWQTGEVEVWRDEPPDPGDEQPEAAVRETTCEKNIRRLQQVVRTQQQIILRQQEKLREQQAVIRRQSDVLRGLDLLRRQGR